MLLTEYKTFILYISSEKTSQITETPLYITDYIETRFNSQEEIGARDAAHLALVLG